MKTNEEHRAAGTFRRDRHAPPSARAGKPPKAPSWLSAPAKKKFRQVVSLLSRFGSLDEIDADAVAAYTLAWLALVEATDTIARDGATYQSGGLVKLHPATLARTQASGELLRWSNVLGLSPKARRALRIEPPSGEEQASVKGRFFKTVG